MPESNEPSSLDAWLSERPSEFAPILALRTALRLTPLLVEALHDDSQSRRSTILLPCLRALTSASIVAVPEENTDTFSRSASAAARHLSDEISELMYETNMNIVGLREIGEFECMDEIRDLEADRNRMGVACAVVNAALNAIQSSIDCANYLKNIGSKDASGLATIETINAYYSALANLDLVGELHANSNQKSGDSQESVSKSSELLVAINKDVQVLDSTGSDTNDITNSLAVLSSKPLWFDSIPILMSRKWSEMKDALPESEGWRVWTDWYEAHLTGQPRDETLESILTTVPAEIWQDSVDQINSYMIESVQAQWDPMSVALNQGLEVVDEIRNHVDLREHKERIMAALMVDPRLVIGATKDMLEAVMKMILRRRGQEIEANIAFSALINTCWSELKFNTHRKPSDEVEARLRKISSQARRMIEAANELRNFAGTGHGRDVEHPLSTDDARMIASIGFVLAGWLVRCEKKLDASEGFRSKG